MKTIHKAKALSFALSLLATSALFTSCQDQLPDQDGDGIADGDDDDNDPPPVVVDPPVLPPTSGPAVACKQWSKAYKVGALQTSLVHEASGLEWSSAFPDRLYHINDSGDGPNVYVSDKKGAGTRKVKLNNTVNGDSEDIALGPCPDGKEQCLVFGDIGDGGTGTPVLTFVKESEFSKSAANILSTVKLTLETGALDMEGMGLHPSGDLFLATKDYDLSSTRILRVPKSSLMSKTAKASVVANIDLRKFGLSGEGDLVTGMDISPDGKSFILLTYGAALEVTADLSALGGKTDLTDKTFLIKTEVLGQQEAIAYIDSGNSFLYDTEDDSDAPLMRIDCLAR